MCREGEYECLDVDISGALPIVLGALTAYIVPRLQALVQRHVEDRDEDKDL